MSLKLMLESHVSKEILRETAAIHTIGVNIMRHEEGDMFGHAWLDNDELCKTAGGLKYWEASLNSSSDPIVLDKSNKRYRIIDR